MNGKSVLFTLFMVAVLLFVSAFVLDHFVFVKKTEPGSVRIAAKPVPEQVILAEMLSLLIENNSIIKTTVVKSLGGGSANIHNALVAGEIDLYPERTGTAWLSVLERKELADETDQRRQMEREYSLRFDLEWVGMYGVDGTVGLAVREPFAAGNGIFTFSDLTARSSDLSFGADRDFFRAGDGFNALCAAYGYKFKRRTELKDQDAFEALTRGTVDVLLVQVADPRIDSSAMRLLRDDKRLYPPNRYGTVVRKDALRKNRDLRKILLMMDGIMNDGDLRDLLRRVEIDKINERRVARDFLKSKGLLL